MEQYSIYGNFNNDGFSSTSYSLSATSISANTFFGDIGASFIGSGNPANFVTNQELSYMSATTGNVQTQINTKTSNLENYFIYSGDNSVLTNSYKIVPSLNLTSYTDNNFFYLKTVETARFEAIKEPIGFIKILQFVIFNLKF